MREAPKKIFAPPLGAPRGGGGQNLNSKFKTIGIIKLGILFIGKVHFTKLSVIENLYPLFYIVIFLFVILYNFRAKFEL